ncbi:hypothetical protein [Clostridium estertheticum]|uniref:hypothetical protein n=1 Tax=Clostridium estertheticum TaxID=238834 RepID=UPI001C7CF470|nr:hypothetical protein [Clostridium estertheticum]MBX4268897.1 hypothetical protein [Clostridium estertheticum]WLC78910.1 hypothetical protein KTC98_17195 [Clostridium estertheticum]
MPNNTRTSNFVDSNTKKDKTNPLKTVTTSQIPTKEVRDDGNKLLREIRGSIYDRR